MRSGRWALGGKAPVIGARMALEGCAPVVLGARVGSDLLAIARSVGLELPEGAETNTNEVDDIHLILEYKAGEGALG